MKKITTLFAALFLCLGLAQAQDVYVSGNHFTTGKVLKNNTLLYSLTDSLGIQLRGIQVAEDGTVYGAGSAFNSDGVYGRVWMNDSCVFVSDNGTYFDHIALNGNDWIVAGFNNIWQNGELLYSYDHDEDECHIHSLAVDATTGDIYAGGAIAFNSDSLYHASVWKNNLLLWMADSTSSIQSICFDGDNLYAAGFMVENDSITFGVIWQNDSIIYQLENANFGHIAAFEGSLYWTGISLTDTIVNIWQDGEVLFDLPELSGISNLVVNESGVYYTDAQTVYKDGEVLYQPDECIISDLVVLPSETPQPQVEPLALPWFDGFEADSTWVDWTVLDFDGNTAIGWERNDDEAATDDYSARHLAFDNIQEGWLITPPLYLQSYSDSAWVSFKTLEVNPSSYTSSQVMISTTGTELSDFTEIWSQDNPSNTWDSIYIDLTEYQGDTIYLAFKYSGHHGHDWYIDDVNVDESLTLYTITVESNNPDWGTVTGGGTYPFGDTIQIEAIPNIGHEFLTWNDGLVDNPRDIVVTHDSTFVALFAISQYTIEVISDHPGWGTVTGGGTYYFGDTIQIEATPYMGFAFAGWDDGIMDNPRTVIVTEDHTFTAQFEIRQCVITTEVYPENSGTVNGGGTYNYGSTVHLTAHSNTGYTFSQWNDGNLTNPRSIFVEGDATYTAVFTPLQYEITTECDPVEGGTVTGAGIYDYGTVASLTATPNENYIFLCWSDGIVSNPRNVTVTGNANYKALFYLQGTPQYTITVLPNDPALGTVTGGGTYPQGSTIEISATPFENVAFRSWDDGNTDNPRSITVTGDMTFTALFEAVQPGETYTITVRSENPLMGTVFGGGTYPVNTIINIGASPNQGFYFSGWQDGDMNNPRSITVTGDAEYVASFSTNPTVTYTVTVYYDETQGFIIGAGTYNAGATASLAAIPADGYYFKKWGDGNTDNPREILVDHDIVLAAFFEGTGVDEEGFENVSLYPNPANDKIRIEGLEGEHEISIYNAMGMKVMAITLQDEGEIHIDELSAGLYLLRIDEKYTMRFVKR
ncbi:MAG: choice-of-anchor J domain-containing protein [bacterium]|nr:choice-of-anchor J domain-containing protein [bacterium]